MPQTPTLRFQSPRTPRYTGTILLPLRAFLGVTFLYAGLQKFADRAFLSSSNPASINAQMEAAARTSPIGGLLGWAGHFATLIGLLIAFGEIAVGVGALLGLWTRVAALGGMLLSLGFLLAVSWHTQPYYLGPDIISLFAWTPLAIAGDGGVLSLDAYLRERVARQTRATGPDLARRQLLTRGAATAVVTAFALVGGGLTAAAGRLLSSGTTASGRSTQAMGLPAADSTTTLPSTTSTNPTTTTLPGTTVTNPATTVTSPTTAAPSTTSPPATSGSPTGKGVALAPADKLAVGQAGYFTDPATGTPAILVRVSQDQFSAHSALCTHAGCMVNYSGSTLDCPCHGAVFDSTTGQVLRGPAQRPLAEIPVQLGSDGEIYVDT